MSVAIDQRGMIGSGNELPWDFRDFPEDMKHFRELTLGNAVVMGRGCFESMGSKPLKGRHNIIVTSDRSICLGMYAPTSLEEALKIGKEVAKDTILIGGRGIYKEALQHAIPEEVYVTLIENVYVADIKGELGNLSANYDMVSIKFFKGLDENQTPYHIIKYVRKF